MARVSTLLAAALLLGAACVHAQQLGACTPDVVSRVQWGAGTNSFGIEGATKGGARSPSIWDGTPGVDAGLDFYNRYPTDITLMKQLGLKHLRLSLSWSRLLPKGGKGTPVNPEGVAFYSKVLDSLEAAGIEPMVVLYHWDLPQTLQDAYGGFLSPRIVDDFTYYADTAFRLFGSRVKRWITVIEPAVVCNQGYGNGQHRPGVSGGDAGRYTCGHNLLLSHADAVQLYRAKYARTQGGQLSFTTLVTWAEPASSSAADKRAAQNKLDAEVGWFLDPVFFGDWPASLKESKGQFLPALTPQQQQLVKGSLDFVAVAAFTSRWVSAVPGRSSGWSESKVGPDGRLIGPATGVTWMNVVPSSQAATLRYLAKRYGKPLVISSSGTQQPGEGPPGSKAGLDDAFRVSYYSQYLNSVCEAVASGDVKLLAWYAWSLFTGAEPDGTVFGVVDATPTSRTPKASARWLSQHFWKPSA